jgi:site-specific recombinase XerC
VLTREQVTEFMRYEQRPRRRRSRARRLSSQLALSIAVPLLQVPHPDRGDGGVTACEDVGAEDPDKLVPIIAPGDLQNLFKAVSGVDFESRRDKAIIGLFIDTGLRIGEMSDINLDDLDMNEREVIVTGKGRPLGENSNTSTVPCGMLGTTPSGKAAW